MTLHFDYSCPHCGATVVLLAGQVTVPHPAWCPRSRKLARSPRALDTIASAQQPSDRRGRCTICGRRVPVAAGHRHPLKTPMSAQPRSAAVLTTVGGNART